MNSLNRVLILGTLGQTPLLKQTKNGKPFCRMSLATNSWETDDDGKKKTHWHSIHVFGRQAELAAEYLKKGRQVLIEGKVETSTFEESGKKQWKTWITADRLTFIGSLYDSKGKAPEFGPTPSDEVLTTDLSAGTLGEDFFDVSAGDAQIH